MALGCALASGGLLWRMALGCGFVGATLEAGLLLFVSRLLFLFGRNGLLVFGADCCFAFGLERFYFGLFRLGLFSVGFSRFLPLGFVLFFL